MSKAAATPTIDAALIAMCNEFCALSESLLDQHAKRPGADDMPASAMRAAMTLVALTRNLLVSIDALPKGVN